MFGLTKKADVRDIDANIWCQRHKLRIGYYALNFAGFDKGTINSNPQPCCHLERKGRHKPLTFRVVLCAKTAPSSSA